MYYIAFKMHAAELLRADGFWFWFWFLGRRVLVTVVVVVVVVIVLVLPPAPATYRRFCILSFYEHRNICVTRQIHSK